jgi:phosphotriesterase-related protein
MQRFAALLCLFAPALLLTGCSSEDRPLSGRIMTVNGWLDASDLGITLPHEHVLVDFAGAEMAATPRYDADSAYGVILPHLLETRTWGLNAFVECTPVFLGRDPRLLRALSETTGLHILTNTGYYAARQNAHLPAHALEESADELANRWTREWREGIGETSIRPGFIKIGLDAGPLTDVGERIVRAAARTHLKSGLTIAAHTGDGQAATAQMAILQSEGVGLSAWIWVHAQNETDLVMHKQAARRGAWISFDGLTDDNVPEYVARLSEMKEAGLLDHVLVSHDAGWYRVGEPGGGTYRSYGTLFTMLLPALTRAGFSEADVETLTRRNPASAFSIAVRRP